MKKITVIGLGAGNLDQMTLGIYRLIKDTETVYTRTKDHPAIEELDCRREIFCFL